MPTLPRRVAVLLALTTLAATGCGQEGEIPTVRADGRYEALAPTAPTGVAPTEDGPAIVTSSPRPTPTEAASSASEDATPDPSATPSPSPSPSPTATETSTEDAGPGTPGEDGQTYALDPVGPVDASAGEAVDVRFADRYDDGEMPASVDVLLVVCEDVEVRDGELRFLDANDEGTADGRLGDPQRARITRLNGTAVDARTSVSDLLLRNGAASVTVEAQECVWVVFYTDADGDGELAVDDEDLPEETFGATKVDV